MLHRIPRISTRGYYDLCNGKTLKARSYDVYPLRCFYNIHKKKEVTVVVHGLHNNKANALSKFLIMKKKLDMLNYRYPIIVYSYDTNVKCIDTNELKIGIIIAKKNGKNLSRWIIDFKKNNNIKIRLVGYSLGSYVISDTIMNLDRFNHVNLRVCIFFWSIS